MLLLLLALLSERPRPLALALAMLAAGEPAAGERPVWALTVLRLLAGR